MADRKRRELARDERLQLANAGARERLGIVGLLGDGAQRREAPLQVRPAQHLHSFKSEVAAATLHMRSIRKAAYSPSAHGTPSYANERRLARRICMTNVDDDLCQPGRCP
jgi:hypothetical protein